MDESPDVAEALRSFYQAFCEQDRGRLEGLLSGEAGFLMIGSNDAWVRDRRAVLDQASDEVAERSPRLVEDRILALAVGNIGWAADRPTMVLPNGREIPFRYTCVMHRQAGAWTIVQSHLSAAVPDTLLFGDESA